MAALDFSVWALFLRADVIVKAVIVILFLASIWCWAIIIEKTLWLRRLNAWARPSKPRFGPAGRSTIYSTASVTSHAIP